jgi:uncharacterized protein
MCCDANVSQHEIVMKSLTTVLLAVVAAMFAPHFGMSQPKLAGDWYGAIALPGVNLGMIVHFAGPNDSLRATIDIPMQMAMGLRLTNVRASLPNVHFELPAGPGLAVFDGTLAGDSITGGFHQASITATFSLGRFAPQKAPATPPPPYREEEVVVHNSDVTLAGTLTLPEKGGPFPAAILITGSGAQNRDEEIFGFAPFRILADHLTRKGIAVLRCDDRGVGGSTGSMAVSTTADFAGDVRAMFAFLQARSDIKASRVGLIGHSEGGEIAAMVASGSKEVAFVVLLAGPAIRGDSTILSQIRLLARAQGESEDAIEHALTIQRRVFATVRAGTGWEDLREQLLHEMHASIDRLPEDQRAAAQVSDSVLASRVDVQMRALRTPWFAYFISCDPVAYLANIACPVLALFGELDQQVPVALNGQPMKEALGRHGNPDITVTTLPAVNHLFQKAVTGNPSEYAGLEKKFGEGVLDQITAWLLKRVP